MTKDTVDTSFDLQAIHDVMQDSAWLTILHPRTGAPTPMRIKIASPDSESYRKVDRRIKNRSFAAVKKNKGNVSAEALEASSMDLLVGITLEWENVVWGGTPMEFTEDNVRQLFTQFPFIREQVDEFAGDRNNFFSS